MYNWNNDIRGLLSEPQIPEVRVEAAPIPQAMQQAPQSEGIGIGDVLKGIAYGFVPNTMSAIEQFGQARGARRAAVGQEGAAKYKQLAEYWADKDPQKAGQYLELASATQGEAAEYGLNPQVGVNPETGKTEYFVTNKRGQPRFLGVGAQQKFSVQGDRVVDPTTGIPVAELPMTQRQRKQEQIQIATLQNTLAGGARADQALNLQAQQALSQMRDKEEKKRMDVRKAEAPIKVLDQKLDQLDKVLEGSSRIDLINPLSDKNAQIKSLISQIQLNYKDVAGLGALVGADFNILDGVIQRPENLTTLAGGSTRYKQQIQAMKNELEIARQGVRDMYGERSNFAPAPAAQAKPAGIPSADAIKAEIERRRRMREGK